MSDHPDYVAALLAERAGYAERGLARRVAEVDAELARFGVQVAETPVERATARPGEKRTTRRSHGDD